MDSQRLRFHLDQLACIERSDVPMASCYMDLCDIEGFFKAFAIASKGQGLSGDAVRRTQPVVQRLLLKEDGCRSIALFHREGAEPWSMALRFRAALPNRVSAAWTPAIYPLVELADTFEPHAVLLVAGNWARLIEAACGEAGRELNVRRPDLREREGREWTKEHYLNHQRERFHQFCNQVVSALERFMSESGLSQFILAGRPRVTSAVCESLPRGLAGRLIDTIEASPSMGTEELISMTHELFARREAEDSLAMAGRLEKELRAGGPAVAGAAASIEALRRRRAGILVLARDYEFGSVSICENCKAVLHAGPRKSCPLCMAAVREVDFREELARLAARSGCVIETVAGSESLRSIGGAGCLLRPHLMARHRKPAA